MGLSEEIRRQLIESFKSEQRDHIQVINQGLLALEQNPNRDDRPALLNEIFRAAHSLKGAARAVGLTSIESLGHALEDLLLSLKEGRLTFAAELFDLLYQTLDAVELVMGQLDSGKSTPPTEVLVLLARLEQVRAAATTSPVTDPPLEAGPVSPPSSGSGNIPATHLVSGSVPSTGSGNRPAAAAPDEQPHADEESLAAASEPRPPTVNHRSDETIRVSVTKLDNLMAQFSELLGAKIRAEQRLTEVREMQALAVNWQKEWQALRNHYSRLLRNGTGVTASTNGHKKEVSALIDFVAINQEQLRAFNNQANILYRQLANDTMRLSLIIDELQEEIKRVRMLPLTTITASFGRMVRDLAREQGKQIKLTISGGDTELDKRVLEQIKDPLIHLLRNAVDHGIEAPAEREKAGKPAEGQLTLAANQQGHNVVITVSDDGRGLDLAAIRLAAVRKGWLSPVEVEKLSDEETVALIFSSGLSTSQIITDISGRGVGLDVVRQNVEELHGTLEVKFKPGHAASFMLTLPLTLASSRGLLIRVGDQVFALPHSTVERMLHLKRSDVVSVEGKEAITYQGRPVALAWLGDILELSHRGRETDQLTVVIVAVAEKRLGLIVDGLAGEQEIVMKGLGKQLPKVGGIAGATVLGSGQVILVLHTADLVKLAGRATTRSPLLAPVDHPEAAARKTILVVDDSITTRTLEKNILEAAGYQVKLATDGQEALGSLVADGLPHLIVSDINMPRLDGFELTQRVKQDSRYAGIPVILVTSLDSPADKSRGIEVGADAYIVKSSFDQGNLLETIEQLI